MIIFSDKTQLTEFTGNKQAYPVYLTIGNIPRSIRRKPSKKATVLLAYLSADKILSSTMSDAKKTSQLQRLFHESLKMILEPLVEAGKNGVEMADGKGYIRKVHPILACYVADYPEQCLISTVKYGTCPKCHTSTHEFGNGKLGKARTAQETLSIIDAALQHPKKSFKTVCREPENNLGGHVPDSF